jgi:hypothetical protein
MKRLTTYHKRFSIEYALSRNTRDVEKQRTRWARLEAPFWWRIRMADTRDEATLALRNRVAPRPVPLLQRAVSQQDVQAYNLVLSPMMMQPGSQCFVQFLSRDHIFSSEVEFSLEVVYENFFTWDAVNLH